MFGVAYWKVLFENMGVHICDSSSSWCILWYSIGQRQKKNNNSVGNQSITALKRCLENC